jgi:hypothetical protein
MPIDLFGCLSVTLNAIGVFVAIIVNRKKIKEFFSPIFSALSNRVKKNVISNYFISNIPDGYKIDYFFYQLGLRETLPIMDWLYLEYINFLNKKFKIGKLVIFPTIDKSKISQTKDDFNQFEKNIRKVVKNLVIEIVDPYQDSYFEKEDLVSEDFIKTLEYIGSKKYFKFLWDNFNIRITSISDFNKFRPVDNKIKDIYTHIYKSWCIVNYIKKNIVSMNKSLNISTIFWEWEVDKFGVIRHYSSKEDKIALCTVLGKTQMLNKTTPVPVFMEHETICIFDDSKSTIEKALKFMPSLEKYNSLLESVLISQYDEVIKRKDIIADGKKHWVNFKTKNTHKLEKTTKDFFLFLGLIAKIRSIIENGNT